MLDDGVLTRKIAWWTYEVTDPYPCPLCRQSSFSTRTCRGVFREPTQPYKELFAIGEHHLNEVSAFSDL